MPLNLGNHTPIRFTPITFSQMEKIEFIRKKSRSTMYVYTFASLFVWQEHEGYEIYISDDAFLIRHGVRGEDVYLFPCGTETGKKQLIDTLLTKCSPVFSFVTDEDMLFLERVYSGRFRFTACRDDYPYLYDKDEQIALAGKEFKNLRHQVNLGRSMALSWSVEPLCDENVDRARIINRKWTEGRSGDDLADTAAAEKALCHFSQLQLWGALFKADDKDVAYAAGVFVIPEIFDVSFCKVLNRSCDCFIKRELYRFLPDEVKTVDSEEDMGLPGLRTHKLLRRPKELIRIWEGRAI
ncbi:MAG: DUF2156 domain-containing protein [Clostridia bacterium]|nr:DUF2156 domain-containing protein [Clostridia bacterium]